MVYEVYQEIKRRKLEFPGVVATIDEDEYLKEFVMEKILMLLVKKTSGYKDYFFKDLSFKKGVFLNEKGKACDRLCFGDTLWQRFLNSYLGEHGDLVFSGYLEPAFSLNRYSNIIWDEEEVKWYEQMQDDKELRDSMEIQGDRFMSEVAEKYRYQAFSSFVTECGLYDASSEELECFGIVLTSPYLASLNSFSEVNKHIKEEEGYKRIQDAVCCLKLNSSDSYYGECFLFFDTYTSLIMQGYGCNYDFAMMNLEFIMAGLVIKSEIEKLDKKYHFL